MMVLLDQVKHLLKRYKITPKKTRGQNFCVDLSVLKRMIEYAEVNADDTVLDIGAGFGFLTDLLLKKAKKVIAVESDSYLVQILQNEFSYKSNLSILEGDVLKLFLPRFNKIVANPPYNISTELIYTLLDKPFERAILTLQKEFVEKIIYKKNSKSFGSLMIIVDYKWNVKRMECLPRTAFYPIPTVDSVVVQIEPRESSFKVENTDFFFNFVKKAFTKRRKTMRNVLASFLQDNLNIREKDGKRIIQDLPFLDSRITELMPVDLGRLSDKLYRIVNSKKITFKNHRFYIFPEVYLPSEDTFLLASSLTFDESKTVLDMGTGCGLLGIVAAEKAEKVVAIDINPHAVDCAKLNARLNGVIDGIDVRQGDLFDSLTDDERFDIIVFNPPYLPTNNVQISGWLEMAWNGGASGRVLIDRFLEEVTAHLNCNGKVFIVQSSLSNPKETIEKFESLGFEVDLLVEKKLDFEMLQVLQARLSNKQNNN